MLACQLFLQVSEDTYERFGRDFGFLAFRISGCPPIIAVASRFRSPTISKSGELSLLATGLFRDGPPRGLGITSGLSFTAAALS